MSRVQAFGTLGGLLLLLASCIGLGGCGSSPRIAGNAGGSRVVVSQVAAGDASDVAIYAVGLVGTPYRYGANTPASGFDCSGLIGHVYKTGTNLNLPRSVAGLQQWGQPISSDDLRSGDLVFFGRGEVASHAGVYVGEGRFVHAPSTGGTVRLDLLSAKYWVTQRVQYRRP